MDSTGPSSASGGMMALTREPSASRASTIGLDSSMRRPTELTIRSMIRIRCASSLKTTSTGSSMPWRSTYTWSKRLTRMSEIVRVGEQLLERPEAEQLVEDVADQRLRARTG